MTKLSKLSIPVTLVRGHLVFLYDSDSAPVKVAIEEALMMKGLGDPLVVVKDDSASIKWFGHIMTASLPEAAKSFIDAIRSCERPETPVRFILEFEKWEE